MAPSPTPAMKAVIFDRHGGPEVLRWGDVADPSPGPDQAVVQVKACALNRLDIWLRQGIPGLSVTLPHVLGADVSGTIERLGTPSPLWKVGQKVLVAPGISCGACPPCSEGNDHLCASYDILGQQSQGGYAEKVVVAIANLLPFPEPLGFEEAASLPLVFLTAWHMLVTLGRVREGHTVLVHGGGSGVGIGAIQIARLRGARVITTVGSKEKAAKATSLGAEEAVLYREKDFLPEVLRWSRRGVDLVVDHFGLDTFEKSIGCLARGGALLACGSTSGRQVQFDLRSLFGKNARILGSRMGRKSGLVECLSHIVSGRLKPVVDSVFPLTEATAAHLRMESRQNFGKIVLSIR